MTGEPVPGCPVSHSPRTYWFWATVTAACLAVALLWPAWWSTLLLGVAAFVTTFHPFCRYANRRGYSGAHPPRREGDPHE